MERHIALLDSKGKLAALFLTEAVESCSESPYRSQYGETKEARKPPIGLRYYRPPDSPRLLWAASEPNHFHPGLWFIFIALYRILKR
jgi:hypothetical protein